MYLWIGVAVFCVLVVLVVYCAIVLGARSDRDVVMSGSEDKDPVP